MDIPIDVYVVCGDGPFGYLDGVLLNPITDEVTHLVVEEDKLLGSKRLVPVDEVNTSSFRYISLHCTVQELSNYETFAEVEFIPVKEPYDYAYELPDLEDRMLYSWPFATTKPGYLPVEHEHIPANELVIHRSVQVFANDGKVGTLDKLMIAPDDHKITDLVVRVGYFWGYKDIAIPLEQIERIKEDHIYLKLSKEKIESFPAIPDQVEEESLLIPEKTVLVP